MNIENYLSQNEFKTRGQLVKETGLSDRCVRDEINRLRKVRPVISNSKTLGYKLAKDLDSFNTAEEAKSELGKIKLTISENNSRVNDIEENNKVCIDYQRRLEEKIILLENEKHIPMLG